MQEVTTKSILEGYSDAEKGAYLGAIASLASADRVASEEELSHLRSLADAAALSDVQREAIVRAATELSGEELRRCLDILKTSDLRFSLVTDLLAFASIDKNYSEEEKDNVEKITNYLGVNRTQFSLLDQFVQRTNQTNKTPEELSKPGFLESLGLRAPFEKAGINLGSSARGLLGMLGPMLLGGMLARGARPSNQNRRVAPGGFGGLGSIFSALNGGGTGGIGSLLKRIL